MDSTDQEPSTQSYFERIIDILVEAGLDEDYRDNIVNVVINAHNEAIVTCFESEESADEIRFVTCELQLSEE